MPDTEINSPFEAYKGDAPYVFVSYSHKDAALVFLDLARLREHGVRIWFDEGIDPGNEWPEEIAAALEKASLFLVFITPNAVASKNVKNEINFALNNGKPFLAVHIKETSLPKGLELRMGDIQAILKFRMSEVSYWRKLQKVLPDSLKDRNEIAGSVRTKIAIATTPAHPTAAALSPTRQDDLVTIAGRFYAATGINMVPIPAGTFVMGSPDDEIGRSSAEGPQTRVTLTQPFWLGRTPVTQGQYQAVVGSKASNFKAAGRDAPVENLSWDDALAFCAKLTRRERAAGRLPAGYTYTLPTEAQWEYACRAGMTGAYAGDLKAMAWYSENSGGTTHPVGTKQPNAWGLCDMHGNVCEWCRDWYADKLPGGEVANPKGPASGSRRVFRGGGWDNSAAGCRSAFRLGVLRGYRDRNVGFRLALSAVR